MRTCSHAEPVTDIGINAFTLGHGTGQFFSIRYSYQYKSTDGTGQFFRYDIRINTNRLIFDISFDTCVKDRYI